ncbi:hypothetical protein GL309_37595 [Nocardia seriolae]|nr:hypothetical protein [Nocardia seriolae]
MGTIGIVKSSVAKVVRRGRRVAWTPEFMRLGNLLYVGLWAFSGRERRVLLHASRRQSVEMFPMLRRSLFIDRSEVRMTDRRELPWRSESRNPDVGFDPGELGPYIREMLLPESPVLRAPEWVRGGDLVVNVRRGDYFGTPHQSEYGMNTVAYTLQAVEEAIAEAGTPTRLVIVSDDLFWCAQNLRPVLDDIAPVSLMDGGVVEDLQALVHAPRLIVPNSTFSYWGGYIGDELRPGRQVVAPIFFGRLMNDGRAHQLRPHWHVVRDIPGGWAATGP